MLNLDPTTLNAVVEQACASAAHDVRWLTAIGRAAYELECNPFVERNPNGHGIIIGSTSGECYSADTTCTCRAYAFNIPCYHRAMARIVARHDEAQARRAEFVAQLEPAVERIIAPLSERLSKARAEMAELFA